MSDDKKKQLADRHILVTGVTGYIGGRLVPRLLERGARVRVLVRGGAARLNGRPWQDQVDIAVGDVLDPATLPAAMEEIDAAYYLIHSMSGNDEFSNRDVQAAQNFGRAAAQAGLKNIIYMGGLGDPDSDLSEHLRSRQETGNTLRKYRVPVTEFQAGMVVGSGSISFEMLRNLAERLPVMICPRWVYTRTQPIAIRDVLNYLVAALQVPESAGEIMQRRLVAFIHDRTRILAAMSHDLKTPITRLRLRAELLDDSQLRAKFEKDLSEMESMV